MAAERRLGLLVAYAAVCVIWGSTYLAIKVGLESFDPFFYAGVRYVLAAAVTLGVAKSLGAPFPGPLSRWWPAVGIGVLLIALANGMVFWAETRLDSGFTALLLTTSPLWTAALSPLVPGEPGPRMRGWLGIGAGLVGTAILLQPWHAGAIDLAGALAAELSVVVWALGSLWVRRVRHLYHPLALSVAQMAAGAPMLLAVSAMTGRAVVGPITPRAAASLAYLVVFGSVIAFAAYFYLLKHWDATRVSTSTYVNPVVAVILGALLLGERVTASMVVGAAAVLAGVTLVLREQQTAVET
jgi:drug/metabolite transporter (DMT)-like permease